MKQVKYIVLSLVAVLFAFTANGQKGNKNEALFNTVSKSYTLNPDGSQELRVVKDLTLYTHTAMNSTYGETFIVYNPLFQELKINESYTRQKDGNIVKTPQNAFVEVLPRSAADAPAYNHLKEMVVVHTGLELGATIHLDYTIITKMGFIYELDLFEKVRETSPIKEYVLSVSVPEDKEVNYLAVNAKYTPKTTIKDGVKTLRWSIRNIPASSRESQVSIQSGGVEMIAVSTYEDADDIYSNVNLLTGNVNFKSPFTRNAAAEIMKGSDSGDVKDKILAARDYVTNNFKLIPLSFADAGFRVRNTDDVVKSAYGTAAELTYVLFSILSYMEINSDVVVCFPVRSYHRALGLTAAAEIFITTDIPGAELLSVKRDARSIAHLEKDYLTFKSMFVKGSEPVIVLPDMKVDKEYDLKLSEQKLEELAGGYSLYKLPDYSSGVYGLNLQRLGSIRKENLLLPYLPEESYFYKIALDGYSLVTPVGVKTIKNKAGELEISVKLENGSVCVGRKLKVYSQLITPAVYKDFSALLLEWSDENNTGLILKK